MNRLSEQTADELAGKFARNRFAEEIYNSVTYSGAVNICQNCGSSCDRLTLVPEFEYMGCDDCMEEALKVIARVQARPKPDCIESQSGESLPEVA